MSGTAGAEGVDHEMVVELRMVIARLGRQLRQEGVAPDQVTLSQLSALFTVERTGPVTLGDLADHEQVKPPTMSRVVAALEEAGLIVRIPDPSDRRCVRVDLTPLGRQLLERSRTQRDALLARRVAALDKAERAQLPGLVALLQRLLD